MYHLGVSYWTSCQGNVVLTLSLFDCNWDKFFTVSSFGFTHLCIKITAAYKAWLIMSHQENTSNM